MEFDEVPDAYFALPQKNRYPDSVLDPSLQGFIRRFSGGQAVGSTRMGSNVDAILSASKPSNSQTEGSSLPRSPSRTSQSGGRALSEPVGLSWPAWLRGFELKWIAVGLGVVAILWGVLFAVLVLGDDDAVLGGGSAESAQESYGE
jgi:hypothetical protein